MAFFSNSSTKFSNVKIIFHQKQQQAVFFLIILMHNGKNTWHITIEKHSSYWAWPSQLKTCGNQIFTMVEDSVSVRKNHVEISLKLIKFVSLGNFIFPNGIENIEYEEAKKTYFSLSNVVMVCVIGKTRWIITQWWRDFSSDEIIHKQEYSFIFNNYIQIR